MKVELFTIRDIEQMVELEQENFTRPYRKEDFMKAIDHPMWDYYVAKREDDVIGMCGIQLICGEGTITNLCVNESYRKLQVGTVLLQKVMEYSTSKGAEAYTLEVRASNQAAIGLYKKSGFVEEGKRKNFYDNPVEDALILWRR
ncbi:MAG: ribosomal protein S18-alanine N-acetyltransferase [Eubacteriales bacterium]